MGDPLLAQPDNHIKCIKKQPSLRVVACVDIDCEKAQRVANILDCEWYSDLECASKNSEYDLVVIASPDHEHFSQIETTINLKNPPKVIFSEKPVCTNIHQLNKLTKLTAQLNAPLLVNHSRRLDTRYKKLKEKIKSKFLGEAIQVNAFYYNGWLHNGTHVVDTLFYLFEDQINWNKAQYAHQSDYFEDFSLHADGTFNSSGCRVSVSAFDEKYFQLLEFDLIFSKGRVRLGNFGNECLLEKMIQNEIGEKVLKPEQASFFLGDGKTSLENAYEAISIYLANGNSSLLSDFRFEAIQPPMLNLLQMKKAVQNA